MARPRKPHGTPAAYRAHKRENTRICDACQAYRDGRDVENPLKAAKSEPPATPKAPKTPSGRSKRRIDPLAETFDNLDTVQAALDVALADDIARVLALSKRKSELIAEITALGGVIEAEAPEKKLDALIDAPTPGGEGALGDNVLGFRKATA